MLASIKVKWVNEKYRLVSAIGCLHTCVSGLVTFFCVCQTGAKDLSSYESEKRPIALYELAGSLAIESKASYLQPTKERIS